MKNTNVEKFIVHKQGEDWIITDDYDIASEFNQVFVGIGPSLANKIPQIDIDYTTYLEPRQCNNFFWESVTETEVQNLTLTLDVKKASGYDNQRS